MGVAFRKAVFAKAQHLLKNGLCEFGAVAACLHAADQRALEPVHAALALPGGHGPAQVVGHAGAKARRDHGDLHHLFLKDGHAQRARQGGFEFGFFQLQRLAVPPPLARLQVGVHHAALDGAGAHDGHLDHQVVEHARLQARQHAHLRAAFDLEHAHGVGGTDHVVGGRIFAGDIGQPPWLAAQHGTQLEAAAQRAEHAQRQHIDLEQPHGVQVVLVPLDDGSALHAGGLHRHQARELALGEHEATHMLAQVARKPLELRGQLQPQRGGVPVQRHPQAFRQLLQTVGSNAFVKPVVVFGKGIHQGGRHGQRLAHIAQGAARAVGGDHGGNGGALAAVFGIDVLDDLLAPVVLKIDVDVGRLAALFADEALEQQVRIFGGHRRDAQHIADDRVGGRAPPLAQDALAARKAHDVVHCEEVHLVLAVRNQRKLLADLCGNPVGHPLRIAAHGPLLCQPGQGLGRRHAGGHGLQWVLVADLAQAESAARCHRERGGQQLGRVDACQAHALAQVALGVGLQGKAAFGHAAPTLHGRDHVLQRLARAGVHVHVARRHQRQAQRRARTLQRGQPQAVVGGQMQLYRQPEVAVKIQAKLGSSA